MCKKKAPPLILGHQSFFIIKFGNLKKYGPNSKNIKETLNYILNRDK